MCRNDPRRCHELNVTCGEKFSIKTPVTPARNADDKVVAAMFGKDPSMRFFVLRCGIEAAGILTPLPELEGADIVVGDDGSNVGGIDISERFAEHYWRTAV